MTAAGGLRRPARSGTASPRASATVGVAGQDRAPVAAIRAGERREHRARVLDRGRAARPHRPASRPRRARAPPRAAAERSRRCWPATMRAGPSAARRSSRERAELAGEGGQRPSPVRHLSTSASAERPRRAPSASGGPRCVSRHRPPP